MTIRLLVALRKRYFHPAEVHIPSLCFFQVSGAGGKNLNQKLVPLYHRNSSSAIRSSASMHLILPVQAIPPEELRFKCGCCSLLICNRYKLYIINIGSWLWIAT